jgi:L-asparaginase
MRHIALITTGGTIEKTYDEATGSLGNTRSIVDRMLRRLRLADTAINVIELMSKDSLHMTLTAAPSPKRSRRCSAHSRRAW